MKIVILCSAIIAPVYCEEAAVMTEMNTLCNKIRAMGIVDAPVGATVQDVISGRGSEGTINFNTSSERLILCYPHLKVYDSESDSIKLQPYSQRLAGVIAAKDVEKGYHWSPSNTEIQGIVGVERQLTSMINDPTSEVNALNECGVVTVFNSYGSDKNPATEIANGHLTFDIEFMPPTPAERITFESFIDIELLKSLGAS